MKFWKQSQNMSEWKITCQTANSSFDKHRDEEARLKLELEAANAELAALKEVNK
jgi:hypothetical protein